MRANGFSIPVFFLSLSLVHASLYNHNRGIHVKIGTKIARQDEEEERENFAPCPEIRIMRMMKRGGENGFHQHGRLPALFSSSRDERILIPGTHHAYHVGTLV